MKVVKSNSGLKHNQYVFLVHVKDNEYLVVQQDSEQVYGLGEILSFDPFEVEDSDFDIKNSPLYNPLFELYLNKVFESINDLKEEYDNAPKYMESDDYIKYEAKSDVIYDISYNVKNIL